MQRIFLLSMQAELREFVMQTQIRLSAVRMLLAHTQQASQQSSINVDDTPPTYIPPHSGTLAGDVTEQNICEANPPAAAALCPLVPETETAAAQDAAATQPLSTTTKRLESIKRRLAEQIHKT